MGSQPGGSVSAEVAWLWAKSGPDSLCFHPLLCHSLDTLAVSEALWDRALTPAARERLAGGLGLAEPAAFAWTRALAGTHDIGKASPTFQGLWEPGRGNVEERGFAFSQVGAGVPHGVISTIVLADELTARGASADVAQALARAIGGHHGAFPTKLEQNAAGPSAVGADLWAEARAALLELVFELAGAEGPAPTRAVDGALVRLAGLVSVADWIASDHDHFPFGAQYPDRSPNRIDPVGWLAQARERARRALKRLGWRVVSAPDHARGFTELFPFSPRTGQAAIEQAITGMQEPFLLVVEDLTGAGKTEASQMCLDLGVTSAGARGGYVALPTRATSDQAFRRLHRFLERAYPGELVDLQLVHGGAQLSVDYEQLRARGPDAVQPTGVHDERTPSAGGVRAAWFSQRKRGLLSTFAVGTIDQALLATLQVRHFFVRLWGLADKVVILDEVHAYDAYMSELLDRLIAWLGALDTTVIVLSATLPASRRAAIVDAYRAGGAAENAPPDSSAYPRLTLATRERTITEGFAAQRSRHLGLRWVDPEEGALTEEITAAVTEGGCVAIVCNTVDAAQRRYQTLRAALPGTASDGAPLVDLLTARYRHREREQREQRCLDRFGPPDLAARPKGAVLVATQIIEQSLDLDFDLLVSELAPVDLLIQRAGRLHRHERSRPPRQQHPELWVLSPALVDGLPQFDPGSAYVYAPHVLLRSWLALGDASRVREPEDLDRLIEAVYAPSDPPEDLDAPIAEAWQDTSNQLTDQLDRQRGEARSRVVQPPGSPDHIISSGILDLAEEEEEPDSHPQIQALTRLGPPSVSAVLLRPTELVNERQRPRGPDDERALLRHSVRIGHQRAVAALGGVHIPTAWKQSPMLRHHKLLELDAAGRWACQKVAITLDSELGVVIGTREQE